MKSLGEHSKALEESTGSQGERNCTEEAQLFEWSFPLEAFANFCVGVKSQQSCIKILQGDRERQKLKFVDAKTARSWEVKIQETKKKKKQRSESDTPHQFSYWSIFFLAGMMLKSQGETAEKQNKVFSGFTVLRNENSTSGLTQDKILKKLLSSQTKP